MVKVVSVEVLRYAGQDNIPACACQRERNPPAACAIMRDMDNPTLRKALGLLAHPATLAAIALLLINDHLLRRLWPSELTGKLGDFAWLFFIPFALTALLALVWPGRSRRRQVTALPGASRRRGYLEKILRTGYSRDEPSPAANCRAKEL